MGATRRQRTGPRKGAGRQKRRGIPESKCSARTRQKAEALSKKERSSCHEAQPKHMWRSFCRLAPRGALHQKGKANPLCRVCMAPHLLRSMCSRVPARLQNAKMNPAKQSKTKQNKTKQKKNTKHNTNKTKWELGTVESKEKRNPVSIFSHFHLSFVRGSGRNRVAQSAAAGAPHVQPQALKLCAHICDGLVQKVKAPRRRAVACGGIYI